MDAFPTEYRDGSINSGTDDIQVHGAFLVINEKRDTWLQYWKENWDPCSDSTLWFIVRTCFCDSVYSS